MTYKNINRNLAMRLAEELQLAAEEKFLVKGLDKIKKQRNCLQIERLQLESLKSVINSNTNEQKNQRSTTNETMSPSTSVQGSTLDFMQIKRPKQDWGETGKETVHQQNFSVDCNMEELDLLVSTPVLRKPSNMDFCSEEEESDDDNVAIDINMLMNGLQDESVD